MYTLVALGTVPNAWSFSYFSLLRKIRLQKNNYCIFFSYIFLGFCILYSMYLRRPSEASTQYCTIPSEVATHLRTDRVCRVPKGTGFEPGTTDLLSGALPMSPSPPLVLHIQSFTCGQPFLAY